MRRAMRRRVLRCGFLADDDADVDALAAGVTGRNLTVGSLLGVDWRSWLNVTPWILPAAPRRLPEGDQQDSRPQGFRVVVVVTGGGWVVCGGGCVVVVVTGGGVVVSGGGVVVVVDDDEDDDVVLLELVVELAVADAVLIRVGCRLPVTTTMSMPPPDGWIGWGTGGATPVAKSAANAAPTSAPIASRPESPKCTSMTTDYRVHSFGSS
jgi:hypothetical protein